MNRVPPGVVTDATGKLNLKKRASRWRRVRPYVFGALAAALVAGLVWLLWFSTAFVVRTVDVQGVELLTPQGVQEAAQVPMGSQLIRVDTAPIAARVGALAPVADVRVEVVWPSSVRINVTERKPVFQVVDGSTYSWVDSAGVVFNQAGEKKAGLPLAVVGSMDARLLGDVATVLAALSPQLAERLERISAATPDRITLHFAKGVQVIWGSADRSDLKSQVATALLQVDAKTYDVSAPENPITRR